MKRAIFVTLILCAVGFWMSQGTSPTWGQEGTTTAEQPAAPAQPAAEQPAAEQPAAEGQTAEQSPTAEPAPPPPPPDVEFLPSDEPEEDPSQFAYDAGISHAGGYLFRCQGEPADPSTKKPTDPLCVDLSIAVRTNGQIPLQGNASIANSSLSVKVEAFQLNMASGAVGTLVSRRYVETKKARDFAANPDQVLNTRLRPMLRSPAWNFSACSGPVQINVELQFEDTRWRGQNLSNNRYTLRLNPPGGGNNQGCQ